MSEQSMDNLAEIVLQFQVDNKSKKESEKSFKSITSLISDLAIIGTVAGKALGKIWGEVTKTISIGVQSAKDGMGAMVHGFDASEFNKIAEALDNIGMQRSDAPKLIGQFDKYVRGFQDPAMQGDKIAQLYQSLGKEGGVDKSLIDMLVEALKAGDSMNGLKLMGEAINQAGESGSDLASMLDLQYLANLELNDQYEDFLKVLNSSSSVYDVNIEKLDQLQDANASITASLLGLRNALAEDLAPGVDIAAIAVRSLVEDFKSFDTWYSDSIFGKFDESVLGGIKSFVSGDLSDPEKMESTSENEKMLYRVMEAIAAEGGSKRKKQKNYEALAPLIGMNPDLKYPDAAANIYQATKTPGEQVNPFELAMNMNLNTIGLTQDQVQDEITRVINDALVTRFGGEYGD